MLTSRNGYYLLEFNYFWVTCKNFIISFKHVVSYFSLNNLYITKANIGNTPFKHKFKFFSFTSFHIFQDTKETKPLIVISICTQNDNYHDTENRMDLTYH